MMQLVLHTPKGGGIPVELLMPALSGSYCASSGVSHPLSFGEQKGMIKSHEIWVGAWPNNRLTHPQMLS